MLRYVLTTELPRRGSLSSMASSMGRPPRIHKGKTPHRIHYIPEWARKRGIKQAQIAREIGVDKSSVSRWWKGAIPEERHLAPLCGLLGADFIGDLFRPPEEDWMLRLLRGRPPDEQERIEITINTAFPRRKAG